MCFYVLNAVTECLPKYCRIWGSWKRIEVQLPCIGFWLHPCGAIVHILPWAQELPYLFKVCLQVWPVCMRAHTTPIKWNQGKQLNKQKASDLGTLGSALFPKISLIWSLRGTFYVCGRCLFVILEKSLIFRAGTAQRATLQPSLPSPRCVNCNLALSPFGARAPLMYQ